MIGNTRLLPLLRRLASVVAPLCGLLLLAAALLSAWREVALLSLPELAAALSSISPGRYAAAAVLCAASYLALAGYEWLAAKHIGSEIPARKVIGIGLVSWAISNTLGPAWLSGSAVRVRLYRPYGISGGDVARVIAFNLLAFWSSFVLLSAVAITVDPPEILGLGARSQIAAAVVVVLFAALSAIAVMAGGSLRIRSRSIRLPKPSLLAGGLLVGLLDNLTAIGALYVLLPGGDVLSFLDTVSLFSLCNLGGLLSGMPGGLGTLDGSLVSLLAPATGAPAVLAAVIAWRVLYGFIPLSLALAFLLRPRTSKLGCTRSLARSRVRFTRLLRLHTDGLPRAQTDSLAPAELARRELAQLSFREALFAKIRAAGSVLLASGAALSGAVLLLVALTRGLPDRFAVLSGISVLSRLDTSGALLASCGALLLFAARGIWLRTKQSYLVALALLGLGGVASMSDGISVVEALLFGTLAALALLARGEGHRRAKIAAPASLPEELLRAASVAVLVTALLPAIFGLGPLTAAPPLTAVGVSLAALAASLLGYGLRPAQALFAKPSEQDIEDALQISSTAGVSHGWLASTGDKALLFDETRTAFLMFGVVGRTWVAYAGPVGRSDRFPALLDTFRAGAREAGARIALYQIPSALVPTCADLGLRCYKFGEDALVPLAAFSLSGRANKSRRSTVTRAEREGSSFEIVPREHLSEIFPALREVSDAWLAKKGREKAFSLGRFDLAYLSRSPVAIVRREGQIIAFANLLPAPPELSVDLMRVHPDAPNGTMDYLFLSLLSWGQSEGYARFNLGMAPLSGLPTGPGAPAWSKLGDLLYRRGEGLYRFQGLRAFKEKFHPDWQPRYLAVESGLSLPPTLRALLLLIQGKA